MTVNLVGRKTILEGLNLPSAIYKMATGVHIPELLEDDCRQLKYVYEQRLKFPEFDFIPLWEGHSTITGCHKGNNLWTYFKFEIECPEEIQVLGTSVHAVIADLLIWLWRERGIEDQPLIELANKLEFPCINKLLEEIEIANDKTAEERNKWEEEFRCSLRG